MHPQTDPSVVVLNYSVHGDESSSGEAEEQPVNAYVFGDADDRTLTNKFLDQLQYHRLEVYSFDREWEVDGKKFQPGCLNGS